MSTYRTSKVGEAFYSIFTVFALDLSTVSGQPPSAFTVRFSRDNLAVTGLVFTIAEIGVTGDYVLTIPGGFPAKGLWAISVVAAYNDSTCRDEVEVRDHDIDDVYSVIVGGFGVETVTLTVVDTVNGNTPVPDALVQVYDDTGAVFITFQRTDTSGEAVVLLDADDYEVRVFKPGFSCPTQPITVVDTGGVTPQAFQIDCEGITVTPPASPQLCRLFADFVSFGGLPFINFKLHVYNLFDPMSSAGLAVVEPVQEYVTDDSGHVEFDLVRGMRVRVSFVTTPLSREFVVPDQPVESLLTVFGVATDAFQIVKT